MKKLIKDLKSAQVVIGGEVKPSRLQLQEVKFGRRIQKIINACRLLTISEVSDVLYLAEEKMKKETKV